MKSIALSAALALLALSRTEAQPMTAAPSSPAPIVFFDIAGPDAAKLKSFYASNFGWSIDGANAIKTPKLDGPCARIRRRR